MFFEQKKARSNERAKIQVEGGIKSREETNKGKSNKPP
jgi:hypothetical protein